MEAATESLVIFYDFPIAILRLFVQSTAIPKLPFSQVHPEYPEDKEEEEHESHDVGQLHDGSEESVHQVLHAGQHRQAFQRPEESEGPECRDIGHGRVKREQPRYHNYEVQPVPGVSEVCVLLHYEPHPYSL